MTTDPRALFTKVSHRLRREGRRRGTISQMELSGIVTMVLVLGGLWGGFAYFLYQILSEDK